MAELIGPSISALESAGTSVGVGAAISTSVPSPEFSSGPPGVESFSSVAVESLPIDTAITPESFSSFLASTEPLDLSQQPSLIDRQFNTPDSLLNATEVNDLSVFEKEFADEPADALDPETASPTLDTTELNEAVGITDSITGGLSIENFDYDPVKAEYHPESDFKSIPTEAKHELDEEAAVREVEDILKGNKPEPDKVDQEAIQIVEDLEQFVAGKEPESDALEIPVVEMSVLETPGIVEILEQQAPENVDSEVTDAPQVEQLMAQEILEIVEESPEDVEAEELDELLEVPGFRERFESTIRQEGLTEPVIKALADTQLGRGRVEELISPETAQTLLEQEAETPEDSVDVGVEEEMTWEQKEIANGRAVVADLTNLGADTRAVAQQIQLALKGENINVELGELLPQAEDQESAQGLAQEEEEAEADTGQEEEAEDEDEQNEKKKDRKDKNYFFVVDERAMAKRRMAVRKAVQDASDLGRPITGMEIASRMPEGKKTPPVLSELVLNTGRPDGSYTASVEKISEMKNNNVLSAEEAVRTAEQIIQDHRAAKVRENPQNGVGMDEVEEVLNGRDDVYVGPENSQGKVIKRDPNHYTVQKAA